MTISGRDTRNTWASDAGQSLVEVALTLPFLLVILLGIADVARVFYYTNTIASAARAGAAYAATNATASSSTVAAAVCNETGFAPYSATPSCPDLSTTASYGPGRDAVVTVTYTYRPLSAYLASRVFPISPLPLRASATYPGLSR